MKLTIELDEAHSRALEAIAAMTGLVPEQLVARAVRDRLDAVGALGANGSDSPLPAARSRAITQAAIERSKAVIVQRSTGETRIEKQKRTHPRTKQCEACGGWYSAAQFCKHLHACTGRLDPAHRYRTDRPTAIEVAQAEEDVAHAARRGSPPRIKRDGVWWVSIAEAARRLGIGFGKTTLWRIASAGLVKSRVEDDARGTIYIAVADLDPQQLRAIKRSKRHLAYEWRKCSICEEKVRGDLFGEHVKACRELDAATTPVAPAAPVEEGGAA